MSSRFINGAKYAVSTSLGAAVVISAVSNASPAVASTTAPPANGAVAIVQSGWPNLNGTVARAAGQVAGASFQLEGVDATDVVRYPAGEGAGTFQVAGTFVSFSQVRDVGINGGDQQFFDYQYVEDESGRQRQVPTFKNAMSMKIELDYDPALPWYAALIALDRAHTPVVLRETLPGGDVIYYYGLISFNKVPTKKVNENMTVTATFSLQADPIRYGAP